MRRTVRSMATALAVGFAVYFAARGVWWIEQPVAPLLMVAAIALYLATMLVIVLADSATSVRMPLSAGILALVAGALIPNLASLAIESEMRGAPFATWFIGATGLVAVVCIVRRRWVFGWSILAILVVSACVHLGIGEAFTLGLVGSITWTILAQLLVLFWDRAVRDTERLVGIQQAVSAWDATQTVRQRERRVRVKLALAIAGPVLTRTVASDGDLSPQERIEARLAEGRLRDELRGASLMNDAVRASIAGVRRRGASVTVFDEGGLEDLSEERRTAIRDELAQVLSEVTSEKVIIRASRDPQIAVTVVGRAATGGSQDEDAVDLWHEIRRDAAE